MNLLDNIRLAMLGLSSNKMRTGLTMLGIIMGVGVVIIVVAIGQGATKNVTDAINSLGTNLLQIRPAPNTLHINYAITQAALLGGKTAVYSSNHLTLPDAKMVAEEFPQSVAAIAPQVRGTVQLKYGSNNANTSLIGTTADYGFVNNTTVDSGRFFTEFEDTGNAKVCVLGKTVALNLTNDPTADLTGKTISINNVDFLVVGMQTAKGAGSFGQDQDDVVLCPINTAMLRMLNTTYINFLSIRCTTPEMMPLAQQQIAAFLRLRHHLRPPYPQNDDFQITSQTEIMQRQASVADTMTSLLSAVAVISLVVGGIGIMNIMLVSVTERTREIGIRKAIGATPRDILMQFLIEAAIISILGGVIGVMVGAGGAILLASLAHWNTIVSSTSVVLGLVVSAAVGLFFGIYPASKAAALSPIDALRYE
ncbi:MAG: ABC transporter permease [Capsulimonadaceae bacterium]|nr:ABC transporter permease [Capsulimonadaceae bacterium]